MDHAINNDSHRFTSILTPKDEIRKIGLKLLGFKRQ
jgi:hypothetical protein